MSQSDFARISVADFVERFRAEMVPLSNTFSFFFAGIPLSDEDVKEYLEDPIAALPPEVLKILPKTHVILVPYLERANGKEKRHGAQSPGSREIISLDPPPENKALTHLHFRNAHGADLLFAIKDTEVADYHYYFYQQMATLAEGSLAESARAEYHGLLAEELSARVHGEVDEESWRQKMALRRGNKVRRDTKAFRAYASRSFIDTATLYLHGICCDIDVETGPRQLPSRYLRKRLMWLEGIYPPPSGYAVFPEELNETQRTIPS